MSSSENKLEKLVNSLTNNLGVEGLVTEISRPHHVDGVWIADIYVGDYHLVIQYSSKHGFGISCGNDSLTSRPDEAYESSQEAFLRSVVFLTLKGQTIPRVSLQELRKPLTQQHVAGIIGIKQPTYARMEGTGLGSLQVSTLVKIMNATKCKLFLIVEDENGQMHQLADGLALDGLGRADLSDDGISAVPLGLVASGVRKFKDPWQVFKARWIESAK